MSDRELIERAVAESGRIVGLLPAGSGLGRIRGRFLKMSGREDDAEVLQGWLSWFLNVRLYASDDLSEVIAEEVANSPCAGIASSMAEVAASGAPYSPAGDWYRLPATRRRAALIAEPMIAALEERLPPCDGGENGL